MLVKTANLAAVNAMKPTVRTRFLTAIVVLFSLLFSQLALAAYECPNQALPSPAAMAQHGDSAERAPCVPSADQDSPNLCQAHGQSKSQSVDLVAQAPVAAFIPVRLAGEPAAADVPLPVHLEAPASYLQAGSCTPALAIRHCRFLN